MRCFEVSVFWELRCRCFDTFAVSVVRNSRISAFRDFEISGPRDVAAPNFRDRVASGFSGPRGSGYPDAARFLDFCILAFPDFGISKFMG